MSITGIKYTAPKKSKGVPFVWNYLFQDGETKQVPEDVPVADAAKIAKKFPDRITLIEDKEKAAQPSANKAMTPDHNKSADSDQPAAEDEAVKLTDSEQKQLKEIEKKAKKGKDLSGYEQDLLKKAGKA